MYYNVIIILYSDDDLKVSQNVFLSIKIKIISNIIKF